MNYKIEHQRLAGLNVRIEVSFMGGMKLFVNDRPIKRQKKSYKFKTANNEEIELKTTGFNFVDPIPKFELNGDIIELVRPLKWYEYVWMAIPFALVISGGALGAFLGIIAASINGKVFRSQYSVLMKYLITGAISVCTGVVFMMLARILNRALGNN